MLCEVPLTKEQQDFAAEHHGLVYKFLNDNHLSENEFYDIVIFAYLKAVKDYFSDQSAQDYSFPAISKHRMKLSVYDYFRAQQRHKRNADIVSIHLGLYPGALPLEESVPGDDNLMQQLEMQLLVHDLARQVSKQQMEIVRDKLYGYGVREIARRKQLPMKQIQKLLEDARVTLVKLCYE